MRRIGLEQHDLRAALEGNNPTVASTARTKRDLSAVGVGSRRMASSSRSPNASVPSTPPPEQVRHKAHSCRLVAAAVDTEGADP